MQFRCSKTRVWSLSGPCLCNFDAKRRGFGLKRAMLTQFQRCGFGPKAERFAVPCFWGFAMHPGLWLTCHEKHAWVIAPTCFNMLEWLHQHASTCLSDCINMLELLNQHAWGIASACLSDCTNIPTWAIVLLTRSVLKLPPKYYCVSVTRFVKCFVHVLKTTSYLLGARPSIHFSAQV